MEPKMIERIRRCLSLAEGAKGTPEGDVAMEKAISLAAKAGIDISTIDINPVIGSSRFYYRPESNSLWRAILANVICKYVGMEMLRDKDKFHLIGRPSDLETFKSFYIRAEREIEEEGKSYIARNGGGKTESDTFRKAAASGFGERLSLAKKQAEESANGRATANILGDENGGKNMLVMIGRSLEVASLKDKLYPNVKVSNVQSKGSSSARSAGYAFGNNMGIHRGNIR